MLTFENRQALLNWAETATFKGRQKVHVSQGGFTHVYTLDTLGSYPQAFYVGLAGNC